MKNKLILFSILLLAAGCGPENDSKSTPVEPVKAPEKLVNPNRPGFSADSAYAYTAAQVGFGPRIPGTEAQKKCAEYLVSKLNGFGANVIEQKARVTAYTGQVLDIVNILARINPEQDRRILLCAHWDTRPAADQDDSDPKATFDGAVDGAASAGILLEIARQLQIMKAPVGVDIVLFDAEDYGNPKVSDSYCLGSQYFAANPPVADFKPEFGILLDMVAAADATFYREGYSTQYASGIVNKVWNIAAELGYSNYFINQPGGPITDDHYFINTILGVPTIDIIHNDPNTRTGFGSYWHTRNDNMQAVNKTTMQAVGEVIIAVVYSEKPNQ